MRALNRGAVAGFSVGLFCGMALLTRGDSPQASRDVSCGAASAAQLRTTLYFGLTRPKGSTVSELEWQIFLRDEVTSRFPAGLTVWDAQGQWQSPGGRIDHERTKVLLLVHADTSGARGAVQQVITRYLKAFEMESVLWETARVCAVS